MTPISDRPASQPLPPVRLDDLADFSCQRTGTDLPVPLCGTCGSIPGGAPVGFGELLEVLEFARTALPLPPFDEPGSIRAEQWVDEMRQALSYRRFMMDVVHDAQVLLREARLTRRMIDRRIRTIRADQTRDARDNAGDYWTHREAGRHSQRNVRVDVAEPAWTSFKADAARRKITVGEALGTLVNDLVENLVGEHHVTGASLDGPETATRRVVQLRIASRDDTWAAFKAIGGLTTARRLGLLIERAAPPNAGTRSTPHFRL